MTVGKNLKKRKKKKEKEEPENGVEKRKKKKKKKENQLQYEHFYFQWLLSLGLMHVFCCIALLKLYDWKFCWLVRHEEERYISLRE